jgi:hypothetical protein
MSKNFTVEVENACHTIAAAAELATKAIAGAAEQAKILIATDAAKAIKVEEKRSNTGGIFDVLYKQVSFYLSIITIVIGGFIYLTNPTQDNDTALQLQDQRITAQRETIDTLTKTAQNDTVEVKKAMQDLEVKITDLEISITRIQTTLEERLPVKK